jgi:hypothetical protein
MLIAAFLADNCFCEDQRCPKPKPHFSKRGMGFFALDAHETKWDVGSGRTYKWATLNSEVELISIQVKKKKAVKR